MTTCRPLFALCSQLFTRFRCFFYGLLLPLSFAPFHLPGLAILSLGLLYFELNQHHTTTRFLPGFRQGLAYGIGFFSLSTSWIYVSIHDYGHLTPALAAFITLLFILYLSLFPAIMAGTYKVLRLRPYSLLAILAFAALWTLSEYLRATLFTGFPWVLVGTGQIDAPTKYLLPLIGVYGVSFITCIASSTLILIFQKPAPQRILPVFFLLFLLLSPNFLQQKQENATSAHQLSIGVVQSNLSMRDKWDENLFWQLLKQRQHSIQQLLGTKLIVLPEGAIPIPATYIQDTLDQLSTAAHFANSALILGIPATTEFDDAIFYNTITALGKARGNYIKQHLVPFGEYIPKPLRFITEQLQLPSPNMLPGEKNQKLIKVHNIPIATLICYELAYGDLLRAQLPTAQFIVSVSDDGWFGHSLAMYQHLQMAQMQSLQTRRDQIMANNDGLSSVIDAEGNVVASLAPFTAGVLKATIIPKTTLTPWVKYGDFPALFCAVLISLLCLMLRLKYFLLLLFKPRGDILTSQYENNK